MLTFDVVYVRRPVGEVTQWFVTEPERRRVEVDGAAVAAWLGTHAVWPELGRAPRDTGALSSLRVDLGDPRIRGDALVLPLRWAGAPALLVPELDADLEVAPLGPGRTSLNLSGRCALAGPMSTWSPQGSTIQRFVQAGIRRFLELLAAGIEHASHDDGGAPTATAPGQARQARREDDRVRRHDTDRDDADEPPGEALPRRAVPLPAS